MYIISIYNTYILHGTYIYIDFIQINFYISITLN